MGKSLRAGQGIQRSRSISQPPQSQDENERAVKAFESLRRSIGKLPHDYLKSLENLVSAEKKRREGYGKQN